VKSTNDSFVIQSFKNVLESFIIIFVVKNLHASICAVQYMIDNVSDIRPWRARHMILVVNLAMKPVHPA